MSVSLSLPPSLIDFLLWLFVLSDGKSVIIPRQPIPLPSAGVRLSFSMDFSPACLVGTGGAAAFLCYRRLEEDKVPCRGPRLRSGPLPLASRCSRPYPRLAARWCPFSEVGLGLWAKHAGGTRRLEASLPRRVSTFSCPPASLSRARILGSRCCVWSFSPPR